MERQEITNLIQKEVRREGKKLSGDIEGAVNQFPNDRIMKSDDDGRLQPHTSITATELSRLEGYLDAAVVTHSTVGTAAATSTALATAGAIKQEVSNIISGAPGALDTLNELAAALGDDAVFATTITNALSGKAPIFTAGNNLSFSGLGTLQLNVNTPDDTAGGTNGDTGLITSNAVFDGLATKHTTSATAEFTTAAAQSGTPWQVLTTDNVLVAQRVLKLGSSGKISTSSITEAELNYLNGVTSNIQTQLNTKATTANPTITGKLVVDGDADYNDPEPLASFLDDGAPTSREIAIGGLGMYRRDHDEVADLRMNFLGYNGGTTQFRNFDVYDGKSALALRVEGSSKKTYIGGNTGAGTDIQSQLDAKLPIERTVSIVSSGDHAGKISMANVCSIFRHGVLNTISGDPTRYYPNLYGLTSITATGGFEQRCVIDETCYDTANNSENAETGGDAANDNTGANAKFGIRLIKAGVYRVHYSVSFENESYNNRKDIRCEPTLVYGSSADTISYLAMMRSEEYTRLQNTGQHCTMGSNGFMNITDAMIANEVWFRLRCTFATGENYGANGTGLRLSCASLMLERLSDAAA